MNLLQHGPIPETLLDLKLNHCPPTESYSSPLIPQVPASPITSAKPTVTHIPSHNSQLLKCVIN